MISALITLLVVVIIVGLIAGLVIWLIDMLPMDGRFKQIARVLVVLVAVLIILAKALPLINVPV